MNGKLAFLPASHVSQVCLLGGGCGLQVSLLQCGDCTVLGICVLVVVVLK